MSKGDRLHRDQKIRVFVDSEIKDLVPIFLLNRRKDLGILAEFLANGDFEEIQFLVDSMIGSGMIFGFDLITLVGQDIQKAVLEKDATAIINLSNNLSRYLDLVEVVYV